MLFVMIIAVTLLASYCVQYWQNTRFIVIASELDSLRDKMIRSAIDNPAERESQGFEILKHVTAALNPPRISLWSEAIGFMVRRLSVSKQEWHEAKAMLKDLDDRSREVLQEVGKCYLKSLMVRHVVLFALFVVTVIGAIPVILLYRYWYKKVTANPEAIYTWRAVRVS